MKNILITIEVAHTNEGHAKVVHAIKLFRTALGCGLKEAKDIIDAVRSSHGMRLRMTPAQFGMLCALEKESEETTIYFNSVKVEEFTDSVMDLTKGYPA